MKRHCTVTKEVSCLTGTEQSGMQCLFGIYNFRLSIHREPVFLFSILKIYNKYNFCGQFERKGKGFKYADRS